MNNIALLTGRGGSSLVDKNVRLVNGSPVLAYPCIAANHSGVMNGFYCSSDDIKIRNKALDYGFKGIIRPDILAEDSAKHIDVINHGIDYLNDLDIYPEILTILMANSATITAQQLKDAAEMMEADHSITSVTPVIENQDHHPYRARKIVNGYLESYFDMNEPISSNRQELPRNYFFTHSFWMIRLQDNKLPHDSNATPWAFMGSKIAPLIVDFSVDIHDLEDIAMTEKWLREQNSSIY